MGTGVEDRSSVEWLVAVEVDVDDSVDEVLVLGLSRVAA